MTRFLHRQTLLRAIVFIAPFQVFGISPEAARNVFDDLVHAIGDGKTQPGFVVKPGAEIAQYLPLSNQIIVSSEFLAFADRFEERAELVLALVLGHELAHHYENHNLRANASFATSNHGADPAHQRQLLEAEADYFAVFFAYMAGYPSEGADENFIRELYAAFHIENSDHYPSLENRIEIFKGARHEIGRLIEVFEAGNLSLLLGQPAAAAHCFEQVGLQFASPEVWNNTGAAYLLSALELLPDTSPADSLLFPVEFEEEMLPPTPEARTRRGALAPEEAAVLRLKFLSRAKECFERTLAFHHPSRTAIVNLACVYLLLANENALPIPERKIHEFNLGQNLARLQFLFAADPATAGQIAVFHGIQAMLTGDKALAERQFLEAAEKHGNLLGKINLNSISGKSGALPKEPMFASFETLHGITLFLREGRMALLEMLADTATATVSISGWSYDLSIRQKTLPTGNAVWMNYFRPELFRTTTLYVLQAGAGHREASARGIKPGSTARQVEEKYGLPKKVLHSRQQRYWTYPETGVLFCLSNGKVTSVFNFFCEEKE